MTKENGKRFFIPAQNTYSSDRLQKYHGLKVVFYTVACSSITQRVHLSHDFTFSDRLIAHISRLSSWLLNIPPTYLCILYISLIYLSSEHLYI